MERKGAGLLPRVPTCLLAAVPQEELGCQMGTGVRPRGQTLPPHGRPGPRTPGNVSSSLPPHPIPQATGCLQQGLGQTLVRTSGPFNNNQLMAEPAGERDASLGGEGPVGSTARAHSEPRVPSRRGWQLRPHGPTPAPHRDTLSHAPRHTKPFSFPCPWAWPVPLSPTTFPFPDPLPHQPLTLSFTSCLARFSSTHLFLPPGSSRAPPTHPPVSLPAWLLLPFHLPLPELSPLKLLVPEARTSERDQSWAPPSKTRLCQEPPHTPVRL